MTASEFPGMPGRRIVAAAVAMLFAAAGHTAGAATDLALTDEERAWLDAHPVVRVSSDYFAPVSFFEEEGGPLVGIGADYLEAAGEMLGVRFELVVYVRRNHPAAVRAVMEGEAELLSQSVRQIRNDPRISVATTEPYLSIPIVVVTRADAPRIDGIDDLTGLSVAGVPPPIGDLRRRGIAAETDVATPEEGLLGVATHRWDAYIADLPIVTHAMAQSAYTNIKINGELPLVSEVVMVAKPEDAALVSALDKAFAAIPPETKDAAWRRWFRVTYEETLAASPWLWGGIAAAVLSLVFVACQVRRLRHRVRTVEVRAQSLDQHLMGAHLGAGATIAEVTNALCRATGFDGAELIGRHLAEVGAPPDGADADLGSLMEALRAGRAWKGEFKIRRKGGGALWASAVLSPRRRGNETVGFTAVWHDITESKRYRELSLRDELTGLFNRRHFREEAPRLQETTRREGKRLTVIALDVDNFKAYNDTYGHGAGDLVLAAVGETLREGLRRETDLAFRLGGEEFAAVLAVAERADAVRIAESVRELLQARAIPHAGNPPGVVTASIGVVIAGPDDPRDVDALLAEADAALYAAKRGGRNRVVTAPAASDRQAVSA